MVRAYGPNSQYPFPGRHSPKKYASGLMAAIFVMSSVNDLHTRCVPLAIDRLWRDTLPWRARGSGKESQKLMSMLSASIDSPVCDGVAVPEKTRPGRSRLLCDSSTL